MCLACVSLARRGPRLPSSQLLVASPALRTRRGCPWWLTILVPQGPGLGVSLLTVPAVSSVFGSQRIFCPFFWCSVPLPCLMSRGDELRQLAVQLTTLAALEDSIALGLSRVMGTAGSGRSAAPTAAGSPTASAAAAAPSAEPSPSHEAAASLLRTAALTSASSRARSRSRSPAPLPKRAPRRSSSTASGLRGLVVELGLVTGLAVKSSPRCFSHPHHHLTTLPDLLHPQPRPPRLPALQRLLPTPMMTGTLSSIHMASPRLPVALRPPSPSRLTPLELVGAPATSAADVCARPPSPLCGGRSDVLSPVLCALSAGVASSCGFVCFSVGAGLLFRWRREADFGGLLRFLPPVLCGARLSLRVGSVLWGVSTAPLVFDVLLGDATLAYTCGAPCLARDCPGGFCPLSRGSCPLASLLCESSRASDLTLRASLAWAFVARFPRSRGVGLHV